MNDLELLVGVMSKDNTYLLAKLIEKYGDKKQIKQYLGYSCDSELIAKVRGVCNANNKQNEKHASKEDNRRCRIEGWFSRPRQQRSLHSIRWNKD